MGGKIGFILILIVIVGVGLFLYSSGILGNASRGLGSLLAFHSSTSTGPSGGGFFGPAPAGPGNLPPTINQGGQTIGAPGTGGNGTTTNPNITAANVPPGFTIDQLSPFFHEVRLAGAYAGNIYSYGTITLSAQPLNASETIDITGWQIKTQRSGEYIPQAIDVYDPSGLTPASDIRVQRSDTVYLYSSTAPFNLRLNECIGYVAHVANFKPPLPQSCPYVNRSDIQNFTGACQNYILSIGSCQQPNMSDIRIPQSDYSCVNYLENNFTYKSCVAAHQGDANFLSNQVWVWTGSNVLDQSHDRVQLLDRSGLLVDVLSY